MLTLRIAVRTHHKQSGFTLIEMLISLAIFALIGVSAYQVLASSALVSEREQKRTELMHELDRALRIIERDLRQVVDRPVRDELGPRFAFYGAADRPLEFTRAGNENPLGLARSDLLRVAYSLREPETTEQQVNSEQKEDAEDTLNLLRTLWRMPDSSLEAPVNEQRLLSDVTGFTARFMDANLTWHDAWPLPQGQGANSNSNNTALPAAIELTLIIAGTGELRRVISLR
ncbi:MAG: type II secretion system minor pseudopilin GspJ [Pseudomonadales bacterium]